MTRARFTYKPRPAWLHSLHPLTKLGWVLGLSVGVFVYDQPPFVLMVLAMVAAGMAAGRVRALKELKGLPLLTTTALLLLLLQVLFVRTGERLSDIPLGPAGRLRVTADGLSRGVVIGGRFLVIVLASQVFVLTTDPSDLAYSLMRAGLPYRYGFALVTALRLVPVFEAEAETVYQAQLTRGVRYDASALRRAYELVRQLTLPVLVSALRRVDALAVSMEGRQFGRYRERTFRRQARPSMSDFWMLAGLTLLCGVTAWLRLS